MTTRHLCFTAWQQPHFDETKMRYMCYGEETCPTTGKLHYQGYLELYDAHRYTGIKKLLKVQDCKFFPRSGRREQAISYCRGNYTTVDGRFKPLNLVFVEHGSPSRKKKDYSTKAVETTITQPPESLETQIHKRIMAQLVDPNGDKFYDEMNSTRIII